MEMLVRGRTRVNQRISGRNNGHALRMHIDFSTEYMIVDRQTHTGLYRQTDQLPPNFLLFTHTHTHPFNGPFSGTTQVSRYQKGKTDLDFAEARDSEWQWHQLGHMQVCILLQRDNHASTPPLFFYRPDALPAAQPTASKH